MSQDAQARRITLFGPSARDPGCHSPTFWLVVKTTSIGFPAAGPLFPVFRAGFGALTGDSAIRPSENTMQGANGGKTWMCEDSGYLEIMF